MESRMDSVEGLMLASRRGVVLEGGDANAVDDGVRHPESHLEA